MLRILFELKLFLDFEKYGTLWPLTPLGGVVWQGHRWLFWSFDYCLQDDIVSFYFVAIFIFFMWMTFFSFWPQWPHRDLEPHHCLCLSSGQGTGHCDQVWYNIGWLEGDTWKYWMSYMYEKYRTTRSGVRFFSYMWWIQYFQVSPERSHPIFALLCLRIWLVNKCMKS